MPTVVQNHGDEEAHLIALCSPRQAPEGHERWTLRMLADKMVELDIVLDCCVLPFLTPM